MWRSIKNGSMREWRRLIHKNRSYNSVALCVFSVALCVTELKN
jgi:hypothetical protein